MAKRNRHRRRTMKGGFLDTLTNWGTSLSQSANSMWEKTKSATTGLTSTPTPAPAPSSYQPTQSMSYGGRTRRRKGGFKDNTPTTGIASQAASLVGGRTRRRRQHRKKTCRKH